MRTLLPTVAAAAMLAAGPGSGVELGAATPKANKDPEPGIPDHDANWDRIVSGVRKAPRNGHFPSRRAARKRGFKRN